MVGFFLHSTEGSALVNVDVDAFHFPNLCLHPEKNVTLLFISQSKQMFDWNSAQINDSLTDDPSCFDN